MSEVTRRPCPFGRPKWPWTLRTVLAADRRPLVSLNRYPGQVIGLSVRLPSARPDLKHGHPRLSLVWATPSRWWR